MKTTKRLIRIFELADGDQLWDIGCDHSLLAKMNLKQKKFLNVYCVDKSKQSLEKIYQGKSGQLRINLQNIILIQSDGCDLDWNSVNGSVVIAGVGGNTILKIVNSCPIKLRSKLTWILNPFTSVEKFDIEISKALPVFNSKKVEVIESGRIRWIYKFSPQS